MAIKPACKCITGIIQRTNTRMGDKENCFVDRVKRWFYEPIAAMRYLCGNSLLMGVLMCEQENDRMESIVQSSATNRRMVAANLYAKRIKSLMSAGLIVGITPTSARKKSGETCRERASFLLVGDMYEPEAGEPEQKADC